MSSKRLISIDPGKASGFAIFDFTDMNDIQVIDSLELDQYETVATVEELLKKEDVDWEIVMEKFTITTQTGKNTNGPRNWSAEIIGAVLYLATREKVPFTEQTPAEAKNFIPNDRMKAVGVWHKGGEGHARDALRHGVLYLVRKKGWRPEGLLASD